MKTDDYLYSIKEFSTMVALSPSAVRFYQKHGVITPAQQPNGYFLYTKHDAFRINAFRMLLSYGFSIQDSVSLLDANYQTDEFIDGMVEKERCLEIELVRTRYRLKMLRQARAMLQGEYTTFSFDTFESGYIARVSDEDNFLLAEECKDEVSRMAEFLGLTRYVRILYAADLRKDSEFWKPSYGMFISEKDAEIVFPCKKSNLLKVESGRVLKYIRRINRPNSEKSTSYQELFDYMENNKLDFRGDILLFPSFFNLDSAANDFETIIVFLK
ncbi:MAG: MerR family transcriptional regulator [Treponema sp.]|nr:MerR family transcriptional regulator [Treponema sp.]